VKTVGLPGVLDNLPRSEKRSSRLSSTGMLELVGRI
jgi:hypothetical protein